MNKKLGIFHMLVALVLLSMVILSPFNIAFADEIGSVSNPTQDDSFVPASSSESVMTDSTAVTSESISTDITNIDGLNSETYAGLSMNTETDTTQAKHEVDVNKAFGTVTPKGKTTPNVMAPAAALMSAPVQQADQPQLSALSRTQLVPQVDNTNGALIYNYPLSIPLGRNNMTPNLSLQYNSQNTTSDSAIGFGWNVSAPYIQRIAKHGTDNLYTGTYDDFTTSDKGELGQISGVNYQLRSDDGSFSKYTFASNTWSVKDKKGWTYSYGTTTASRQDDSVTPVNVYKWMLDSITDTNGNSISYTYYKDQGQIYLDTVTYTNTSAGAGPFVITFGREVATNSIPNGYSTGFSVTTKYRINTITVTISGVTRHVYALGYTLSDNQTRSLLSTITETGYDSTGGSKTLAPTKFNYTTSGSKTFTKNPSWTLPTHILSTGTRQDSRLGMSGDKDGVWPNAKNGLLIDLNADGYTDWIETEDPGYVGDTSTLFGSTNGKFYDVWLGSTSGWTLSTTWTSAMPLDSTGKQYKLNNQTGGTNQLADVNGDGLPDFIITTPSSTLNGDTHVVWLNNGTGWTKSTTWTMPTITVSGTTYGIALGYNNGTVGVSGYLYYTQVVDINNDGLPDLVQSTNDNFGASTVSDHYSVWLNNGAGWTKSTTWTMPVHPTGTGTYYGSSVTPYGTDVLIDINGDGLPDWVETTWTSSSLETYGIWLNTGTGWVKNTTWTLPVHPNTLPPFTNTSLGIQLGFSQIICGAYVCGTRSDTMADVNSDGLVDIVETTDYLLEYHVVWLNNGKNGWVRATTWNMPMYANTSGTNPNQPLRLGGNGTFSTQLADINNDGLVDYVASCDCGTTASSANPQFSMVFINNGSSWNNSSWSQPTRTGSGSYNGSILGYTQFSGTYIPMQHRGTILQDVNGDGSVDWVESNQFQTPPTYALGADPYERYYLWTNSASQSDLLNKVTTDHGGFYTYSYAPQTIAHKNPTIQNQTVQTVVSAVMNDGLSGPTATTTYAYSKGKYFYNNNQTWRKFAGFQKVTITNPDGSKTMNYYHQGDGIDSATYEYSDAESEIGKLYRSDLTDASGNLYKRSTTKHSATLIPSVGSNVYFVYPIQTIIEDFDGNGTKRATAETFAYNTSTGNLSTDTNFGEVTATTPIAYTDIGTDKAITTYSYASNVGGMYAISGQVTVDQSSNKVNETRHYYDGAALGTITLGNETKTEQWKTGTTYVNNQKTYNSNGTLATSTDGRGKVTSYTYDANDLYVATVTDPLLYTVQFTYDYMFGKVLQTTDQNGNIYNTLYDGIGRLLYKKMPDPSTGASVYRTSVGYDDQPTGISGTQISTYTDSGTMFYQMAYYDGLGRIVQEKRGTDPNGSIYDYQAKDYWYAPNGKLSQISLPYIDYDLYYNRGGGAAVLNIQYTYDPEGRVLTTVNNIGTTTNSYDQWVTTTTDPKGNVKKYTNDAYNNLSKVEEVNGASTNTTNYSWDLNNKLTNITDAQGNVRNFTYDGLGRRLTAQDLHTPSDVTFGTWNYTYDAANNLSQSISPNSATVNYTYDNAERLTKEDYTGIAGTEIIYSYDSCIQGIGKLCRVTMSSGANTSYAYDYNGNIAIENKTINSSSFVTYYSYNRNGDIVTITYPDSAVIQYTYISDGLVGSISRKESGGSFTSVLNSIGYSPDLKIKTINYINGVNTTNTYDAAKLYRLTNKVTTDGSSNHIQDYVYTYDADNNITNIVNTSGNDTPETVTYSYDPLNRLKTSTATLSATGNNYTETYNYDKVGNITAKNGLTYLYQGNTGTLQANPHAATSINGTAYTYDNDGNLTANGTSTNTWNYKDQLTQTIKGAVTTNYYYDQAGNRVWHKVGTVNTYYPNRYYSYDGTTKTKQIYLGNQLVSTLKTTGATVTPYYVSNDNVLGTNLVTNAGGIQQQVLAYYPFGDIRLDEQFSTINEKNKFGGHQYDADTDLTYMGARYYAAKIGRFVSEDPSFLAIGDNQQVKSITNQDMNQVLMNPQSLNSYSYAVNNPITNIDPDGKYWEVSASGTFLVYSGAAGIRFDSSGLNLFAAGGVGVGLEGRPISISHNSTELPHQAEESVSVGISGAVGLGYGKSISGQIQSNSFIRNNEPVETSYILGLGADAYARKEITFPIFGARSAAADSISDKPTYLSAVKPQQISNSSTQNKTLYSVLQNSVSSIINNITRKINK